MLRRRWNHVVFFELRRDSRRRGFQASSCVSPGKPKLPFELRGKAGCCARITARPKRPHQGVCPGPNSPLKGRQGSRDCTPDSPGSQASPRGETKECALLSSPDADLLEPTESPQGNPFYSSVWREDSGLLSRPGRKRRPSAREDEGVSGVSLSCGAVGVFSRGTTRISGSLSCGAREARSACARRGGAHHCPLVQRGDKGLKTLCSRTIEVFLEWRRETLISLDFCRGP